MRFRRTTRAGVRYEMSVTQPPSKEALEALDALADAAVSLPTLREGFCAAPPAGSKPEAPQWSPGFRIRPADPDQDPDPEDSW